MDPQVVQQWWESTGGIQMLNQYVLQLTAYWDKHKRLWESMRLWLCFTKKSINYRINKCLFFCRICNLSWEPISNFLSVNLVLGKKWWGWWCFVDEERGSWASQVQTCQVSLIMEIPSTHIFNILNPPGPGLAAESVNPVHSILVVLWDKCFLKMK